MLSFNEREQLISKIINREGTINDLYQFLNTLKSHDPFFESSDRMLYLEEDLNAWNKYIETKDNYIFSKENIFNLINLIINSDNNLEIGYAIYMINHIYPGKDLISKINDPNILLDAENIYQFLNKE